jgi:hypothetical protein
MMFASIGPPSPATKTLTMSSPPSVESPSPGIAYWSVRNCIDGFVHTHAAGLGARKPATSSTAGSSALVEVRHFEVSTPAFAAAAGVLAAGAAAFDAEGCVAAAGGTAFAGAERVGGFGAGASPHAASAMERPSAASADARFEVREELVDGFAQEFAEELVQEVAKEVAVERCSAARGSCMGP